MQAVQTSLPASFRYRRDEIVKMARIAFAAMTAIGASFKEVRQADWALIDECDRALIITMVKRRIDYPNEDVSVQHQLWEWAMMDRGWQYGRTLDEQKKLSPHMRAFEDLPQHVRAEYATLCAIVLEMME